MIHQYSSTGCPPDFCVPPSCPADYANFPSAQAVSGTLEIEVNKAQSQLTVALLVSLIHSPILAQTYRCWLYALIHGALKAAQGELPECESRDNPQQQNRVLSVPLTFFVRAAGCLTHHATAANEISLTRAVVFIFVRRSRYCLTLRYIARGRPTNEDRNSSVLRRTSISECGYRQ